MKLALLVLTLCVTIIYCKSATGTSEYSGHPRLFGRSAEKDDISIIDESIVELHSNEEISRHARSSKSLDLKVNSPARGSWR